MSELRKSHSLIYRHVAFSLSAFDHLKEWQRHIERTEGIHLDNSRLLDRLILSIPLHSGRF